MLLFLEAQILDLRLSQIFSEFSLDACKAHWLLLKLFLR